jgi:hypothetical protein
MRNDAVRLLAVLVAAALLVPGAAEAYVGPGAGLTALGTVFAFFAALVLAAVGFVWYPLKRLLRGRTAPADGGERPQK